MTGSDVFSRICSQAVIDRPNAAGRYTGRGLVDLCRAPKTPVLLIDEKQPLCLASASASRSWMQFPVHNPVDTPLSIISASSGIGPSGTHTEIVGGTWREHPGGVGT